MHVLARLWCWVLPFGQGASALFSDGLAWRADIYLHLGVTLRETVLAFVIDTVLSLAPYLSPM